MHKTTKIVGISLTLHLLGICLFQALMDTVSVILYMYRSSGLSGFYLEQVSAEFGGQRVFT